MKKYLDDNGYVVAGDSVELAIVDIMVVDEDDLLVDISIPIKKI